MRYVVLCVGRKANDALLESSSDYLKRLSRYVPSELIRVREGSLEQERDALVAKLAPAGRLIVLDERGKTPTTRELAKELSGFAMQGLGSVTFVIGGADGLHPDIKARAHLLLSLSRLTLPHRLAQVVLLEQLYRAHTVLRGEPYHRD